METEFWFSEELYVLLTAEPSLQLHLHNFQGLFSCPTVFFPREIVIFNIYTIPEIRPTASSSVFFLCLIMKHQNVKGGLGLLITLGNSGNSLFGLCVGL